MKAITRVIFFLALYASSTLVHAFASQKNMGFVTKLCHPPSTTSISRADTSLKAWGQKKKEDPLKSEISEKRKKQLGIVDEREYDLGVALETNTDPLITKIIAGSFILVVIGLLVAGIVIPSFTDYGDGVCNPITTGGRC
jgi:hypothetical protein